MLNENFFVFEKIGVFPNQDSNIEFVTISD